MSPRRQLPVVAALLALGFALATPASADPDLLGAAAPEVRARGLDDDGAIALESYRGQVLVLAFVASWCRSCARLAPVLAELHQDEAVHVLGLSHEDRRTLRRHVGARELGFPLGQCTGRTAIRYGADALPTVVVLDRRGVVRGHFQGAAPETAAQIRALVAQLGR